MTIQDYLRRLKQWRQQLCVDRLILLVLVLTNALLLFHCLSRKPAVELSLPFMDGQVGIQSGGASRVYYEWWGLSLAELLGAQKGQPGNAFTQFILNHMVAGIVEIDSPSMPHSQTVITLLRALQKELRKKYLLNIASYLILLVPKGTAKLKAQVIHCGECRLGTRHDDGNIIWQTSVHTDANSEGL